MGKIDQELKDLIVRELDYRNSKNLNNDFVGVGFPSFDEKEIFAALDSLLNLQISQGEKTKIFESEFARYMDTDYAVAVNSGSSANLLALLTLIETGRIQKGDEVIVPASTFSTVSSPIYQLGLVPVYVDVGLRSFCIDPEQIEKNITKKSKVIMPVHNLGFPADMGKIMNIAKLNDIIVIEDCCEAHGAKFDGKMVGSFGELSTLSFFVAHNMTTGEGGMIFTKNDEFNEVLRSLREFGRIRKSEKKYVNAGNLKEYDSRYVFNRLGYNMRMTDILASIGSVQLSKLDTFNNIRIDNAKYFDNYFNNYKEFFHIAKTAENEFSSYYTYPIFIKDSAPFSRKEICIFLEEHNVETRAMMAGCLPDQPGFINLDHKIGGSLPNSRAVRDKVFFVGCHPHIQSNERDYIVSLFEQFISNYI